MTAGGPGDGVTGSGDGVTGASGADGPGVAAGGAGSPGRHHGEAASGAVGDAGADGTGARPGQVAGDGRAEHTGLVVRAESQAVLPGAEPPAVRPTAPARRDARVSKPPRHPQWLVNQLPVGMLNSDFFVRFVSLFQELAESLLDGADQVEHIPDSTVTPVPMLGYLASWIGAETVDASLPEELQRLILRSSSKALAHRGTRRGLVGYLEMLSGGPVEVTDGGGVWAEGGSPEDVAWVRMSVTGTGHLSEDEFVALIRDEIPAHVRAELYVLGRRVLCTEEEK